MGAREFNGKQYKESTAYEDKQTALIFAKNTRKGKWHARVVKERNMYRIYVRKIL